MDVLFQVEIVDHGQIANIREILGKAAVWALGQCEDFHRDQILEPRNLEITAMHPDCHGVTKEVFHGSGVGAKKVDAERGVWLVEENHVVMDGDIGEALLHHDLLYLVELVPEKHEIHIQGIAREAIIVDRKSAYQQAINARRWKAGGGDGEYSFQAIHNVMILLGFMGFLKRQFHPLTVF